MKRLCIVVAQALLPAALTLLSAQTRRPELIKQFETYVFGRAPIARPKEMTWETVASDPHAMGGRAITKTVVLHFAGKKEGPSMELSLTLPVTAKPAPIFLIAGNARLNPMIALDRGYGIVACRVDQIQTDAPNGYARSIRGYFAPGHTEPAEEEWGAISAWAWGMSRAMDYLETDPAIDPKRVSLSGIWRYAKVVLWAGAQDQRFAITFAQEPGFGETIIQSVNGRFSYWFDRKLHNASTAPVDWHDLVSLLAPRPVYLAAADEYGQDDVGATLLAAKSAAPVYALFGETGLGDFIGYHHRTGEPVQNKFDWDKFMNFADRHFGKNK